MIIAKQTQKTEENKMRKVKNFGMIAVLLGCLCIGAVFAVNGNNIAHASGNGGGFNEEYDVLYDDIMDRYAQNLITYDEAYEEYLLLSHGGATHRGKAQPDNMKQGGVYLC
jgi:hypothetical protein